VGKFVTFMLHNEGLGGYDNYVMCGLFTFLFTAAAIIMYHTYDH